MALFKKKTNDAPAPVASPDAAAPDASDVSTALDDFSDFAPDAAPSAPADAAAGTNGKGRKRVRPEKKAPAGRVLKNGSYIGLNIGSDSIKVVELTAKGGALSLTGMGMVPTPPESISNGVVMSVNALANAIRDALIQAGIKSKKVVTSVAGTGALVVRIIEVPKMSDGELEDNMKMDADRYIPFPPSEVIMDFKALRELPTDPDAANMEVLLAAAQREIVDLHVQVVQDAKLDPRAIDVEPLAAARALTHPAITGADPNAEADYADVAAILNVGASGTEISILRGDLLVFTRTVPTGGSAITQAIVDTLGLAWHDAEGLKRDMGDALPPHAASTPATAGVDPNAGPAGANDFAVTPAGDADDWSEFGVADDATGDAGDGDAGDGDAGDGDTAAGQTAAGQAPAATDPFDDAFFAQGPQNAEPGEQHQQKEGDDPGTRDLPAREGETAATEAIAGAGSTPDEDAGVLPSVDLTAEPAAEQSAAPAAPAPTAPGDATDIAALFNFEDVEEPDEELPTASEERPLDFNNLLGEEEDFSDLPTLTSDAPAPSPLPSAFAFPAESGHEDVDFDDSSDEALPGRAEGVFASAPESIFGTTAIDAGEASLLPSESAQAAPDVSTTDLFSFADEPPAAAPSTPVSGFNFDLEEPAEPAGAASTPAPAADPFAAFDLGAATATPPAEANAPAAESTPAVESAPAPETTAPAPTEGAEDFDLDSLFAAAPAAEAAAPVAVGTTEPAAFDALGDDFGDDLASFGAGLTGAAAGEIDAQTLYSVIHPVLENLVAEVRRSLEYHTTRYPDAAVRRITLIGGGAKLTNMDAYFTQSLGIPTTVGNPAVLLPLNAPKLSSDYVEENGPLFTVAIGLGMRELVR